MRLVIIIILVILVVSSFFLLISRKDSGAGTGVSDRIGKMDIKSPAFGHNERIPAKYTCDGENLNPPLAISDVPEEAKSLVLIVDDPDAPAGVWTHWTVWNINSATAEIAENTMPEGAVEGKTSFGKLGYGGPCPPSGIHRYFFKIYALDKRLDLRAEADVKALGKEMEGHVIGGAELIGLYSRIQS